MISEGNYGPMMAKEHVELHWLLQHEREIPEDLSWLSEPERERVLGFTIDKRRNDWLVGRWTVKKIVRACLLEKGIKLNDIEVRPAEDGAPEVFLGGRRAELLISLSHSRGFGFCVLGMEEYPGVGCDIEAVEQRTTEFIESYFTVHEQNQLARKPGNANPLTATLIWSAKESCLKAVRQGLRVDTRRVEVEIGNGSHFWQPLSVWYSDNRFAGWWCVLNEMVLTVVSDAEFAKLKAVRLS